MEGKNIAVKLRTINILFSLSHSHSLSLSLSLSLSECYQENQELTGTQDNMLAHGIWQLGKLTQGLSVFGTF